jgi:hypothetical protein
LGGIAKVISHWKEKKKKKTKKTKKKSEFFVDELFLARLASGLNQTKPSPPPNSYIHNCFLKSIYTPKMVEFSF